MRYVGRISEWNDERGFGFVTPNGGGDRAFVHIRSFERPSRGPVPGMLVSYELRRDQKGRFKAAGVRATTGTQARRTVPRTRKPGLAIGLACLVAIALGWFVGRVPTIVAMAYGALSVFAVLLYRSDKSAALADRWRIQESSLHLVALLGGWPGALVAQDIFRHKSSKRSFQAVFWTTVACNCVGLAWLLGSGGLA